MEKKLHKIFLADLLKPEVDKFERAKILKQIMLDEGLSQRGFVEKYNIVAVRLGKKKLTKSTIDDWLLYGKLTRKQFEAIQAKGLNSTQIYRLLRTGRVEAPKKIKEIIDTPDIDLELKIMIQRLEYALNKVAYRQSTIELLDKLKKTINHLMFKLERKSEIIV